MIFRRSVDLLLTPFAQFEQLAAWQVVAVIIGLTFFGPAATAMRNATSWIAAEAQVECVPTPPAPAFEFFAGRRPVSRGTKWETASPTVTVLIWKTAR